MKKALVLLAIALLLASVPACSGEKTVTLNVYNWGLYIDDEVVDVNAAFEEETGIKVNYQTFDSNETMYTLLSSGAAEYDVVFPSDYMVGKMIQEDMLEKIDFKNVPNFDLIGDEYKNLAYDPTNEYSVPYTWGTVGIFYNKKKVDAADLQKGWDILWDEKYKGEIFMFENPRDSFGIALKKLGYSMNTTKESELQAAYQELLRQKPLVQGYFMDKIMDKMIAEEGALAPYYSGDGMIMMYGEDSNPNIDYFVPDEGTNYFVDAMCILKGTPHKKEAEQYINFLCSTPIAKANAEYIGYSTPQVEARKQLDPEIANNPNFYPPESLMKKTEIFLTLPDATNKLMEKLWTKLLTGS